MRTLFVFRQDIRIDDNVWLYYAIQESRDIVPVFILDETILAQFPPHDKRLDFLQQSLEQLDRQLRQCGSYLHVYYGKSKELYPQLVKKYQCDAIYRNKSYGIGSLTRDSHMRQWCRSNDVLYKEWNDFLLVEPDEIKPYKMYTPFSKKWLQLAKEKYAHYEPKVITQIQSPAFVHHNQEAFAHLDKWIMTHWQINGRKDMLEQFDYESYHETRNTPSIAWTSTLSPYIRMGLVSIRKIYQTVRNKAKKSRELSWYETFIKELGRREFWHHVAFHFPETRQEEFLAKRRYIQRENNEERLHKRSTGMTGYPLVDAGMRQLRQENWMHNRVRMVVASFLCKDMIMDWRHGMKEFERYLLDHDSNVNLGSWQWSASVGADPKPLRIFNPLLQSKRFDPECLYIKKYIPELSHVDPRCIHDPLNNDLWYASPILDHYLWSKKAKQRYYESQSHYQSSHH